MNSLDKIKKIKKDYQDLDKKVQVLIWFPRQNGDNTKELNDLFRRYLFLNDDYKNFLSNYNGISLSWCDFLSAGFSEMPSIFEYIEMWGRWHNMDKFCPIAKNAAGDVFCFSENGKVWMFDIENIEGKPTLIADSFNLFLNDCVLGKRYSEFSYTDNNPFYEFLKEQGWV